MIPVVLDCSAIVPWFFPEEDSETSRCLGEDLAGGAILPLAPMLLQVEFANVAWKKARHGLCSVFDAVQQFERFLGLPIRYAGDVTMVRGSLALAQQMGITVYDACYLWLAFHGNAVLATRDEVLYKAARSLGVAVYGSTL